MNDMSSRSEKCYVVSGLYADSDEPTCIGLGVYRNKQAAYVAALRSVYDSLGDSGWDCCSERFVTKLRRLIVAGEYAAALEMWNNASTYTLQITELDTQPAADEKVCLSLGDIGLG